jgi:NTE family protein
MATRVWKAMADENLLPMNKWWETARAFFLHSEGIAQNRIREFATSHGLTPDLHFYDLSGVMLYLVAADMNTGRPIIFGNDSKESILESMLTSMALPPWMAPFEQEGQFLVDGGFVSNLPIETALNLGATEIIALDLFDPAEGDLSTRGVASLISRLNRTVIDRQLRLELQLADARGVPVRHINLIADPPVQLWDFRQSAELIEYGYNLTRQAMSTWPPRVTRSWWGRMMDRIHLGREA